MTTTWQSFAELWNWGQPSVVGGCIALLLGYEAASRFRVSRETWFFAAGVLVLLVSLVSPLDELGDTYLFSAHMLQHLILLQVTPPLLLLGLTPRLARQALALPFAAKIERALNRLPVAWLLAVATLWTWHVPALYNAALADERIHALEHLSFLVTSTVFWWPILTPLAEKRAPVIPSVLYLFTAMAANAILGIILTFSPPGWYPAYLNPDDTLGILPLLRNGWGLTPAVDQEIGGLLMWVAGSLVYLLVALGLLARWYRAPEEDELV